MAQPAISQELTDRELDDILASVETTLAKVDALAKSSNSAIPKDPNGGMKMQKDAMDEQPPTDDQSAASDQATDAAPESADAAEPTMEGAAPEDQYGDQGQLDQQATEGQEDQPMSDEELANIYSQMDEQELQQHYMALRQALQQHMGGEPEGEEQAPPAAPPQAPPQMGKSESADVRALKAKVDELEKGLTTAVKAVELVLQPSRKSVAGIEFIKKNEQLEGKQSEDVSRMTKPEIDQRFRQIGVQNFQKSEREAFNQYFLYDEGRDKVLDIIKSKGAK